ncbi:BnaC01g30080D [Brassica napus]|uniref:BnaC01g30080D protein n=1 Tax=Brassica napus TaxID=3708 RepID=A0A078GJ95_BRANA|nr:BnaC01g30080D [Brassica napus]
MNFHPIPISRIEVPVLLEHPGFSGVASLILLEMAAADQPLNSLSLTEEEVRVAAENYAIAALFMG